MVAFGRGQGSRRDNRDGVHRPQRHPPLTAPLVQPLPAAPGVGAYVTGKHQSVGTRLVGKPQRLANRVAASYHQLTAPLAQAGAQVGQAVMQEPDPVGHGKAKPVVQHE